MAVQTLHGLVQGERRARPVQVDIPKRAAQDEIDALTAQITASRLRLNNARDTPQVGELLSQIYRCEDRIKAIRRLTCPAQAPITRRL